MELCPFSTYCVLSFCLPPFQGAAGENSRIGILFMGGRDQPRLEALEEGLREHGYSKDENLILEYRYAEGKNDRLAELAKEFVREKVDVIVTTSSDQRAGRSQSNAHDSDRHPTGSPVERGLAESLAKPGGNVTGLSALLPEMSGKRVELLKEAFPKITRVAAVWSRRSGEEEFPIRKDLRWLSGTPRDWANESLALTREYVYPVPESGEISEEYAARALRIIHQRLASRVPARPVVD
jgi:ABC-type uncharacterized transport system substrate-binding protein